MGSCYSGLQDQAETNRPTTIDRTPATTAGPSQDTHDNQINGAAIYNSEPRNDEPSSRLSGAERTSRRFSDDRESRAASHANIAEPITTQDSNNLTIKLFRALHNAELGGKETKIILPKDVETVWAPINTRQFYRQRPWYDKSWDDDTTMNGYFRVMSILILINFTKWDDFGKLFIDRQSSDEGLPYTWSDLRHDDWLGEIYGRLFFDKQWMFCPDRIEERQAAYNMCGPRCLPWIDEPKEIGKGAFGRVVKRTIAARYLEYRGGTRNHENRLVAIKSVPETNAPQVEFDNLTELRGCLSEHTRIMVNLATMLESSEHGGTTHHIVYELAAYDLNKFLTLPRHHSRKERHKSASPGRTMSKDMWPGDLIQENSKDTSDHYPVGQWKFADFGLSRVKPRRQAYNKHFSVDSGDPTLLKVDPHHRDELSTSVSNTTPMRDPGRYTAPELDQKTDPLCPAKKKEDGRCADRWSLGCVLSEVITYAVKLDSRRVESFRKAMGEPNLPNRRFYDHTTKDVKMQLISHLDSLPNVALGDMRNTNDLWIRDSIELIKKIVVKDPKQRMSAAEIRDKLGKIDKSMRCDKEPWLERSLALDTTYVNRTTSPSPARSHGSTTDSPEGMEPLSQIPSQTPSQTPSINLYPAGQSMSVPIMKARTSLASIDRRRQTSPAEVNGSTRASMMGWSPPKTHGKGRESR
ncbi:hypothetical protein DE146DRAFT_635898 [Phaeosphaeria sp. MPI-PUGE-AT-0046c]|nr:hypothetical protein DE146DRAFT_635898 [Phaeosphaeria sp. MPI-PUGE-AT-0046c]